MGRKAAWGKSADKDLPQYWCSSEDFVRWQRAAYPELSVPESQAVYLGESAGAGWDPGREAEPEGPCPCGGPEGPIRRGSLLVCPHCHRSGFERPLAEQRRLAGYPPAERPRPQPQPAPAEPEPARTPSAAPSWWQHLAWSRSPAVPAAREADRRSA